MRVRLKLHRWLGVGAAQLRYRCLDGAEARQRRRRCAESMRLLRVVVAVETCEVAVRAALKRCRRCSDGTEGDPRGAGECGGPVRRDEPRVQSAALHFDGKSVADVKKLAVCCSAIMWGPAVARVPPRQAGAC